MFNAGYYKRYRMEIHLGKLPPVPWLGYGFSWLAWDEDYLTSHAEVKCRSFWGEIDTQIFPNLGYADGCIQLMRAIRQRPGFCPAATWLIAAPEGPVTSVQGVRDDSGFGAIQNLGVLPEYRRMGLGRAALLKALHGFRSEGMTQAFLEVTAHNTAAYRLYRQLGFYRKQVIYREVQSEPLFALNSPNL